ncbi:Carboxy-terminal domain cyclin [Phytophthora palmivora]|uniref:Carboxy-terminal domain cyclin n=1 Tax=Phytophthora palmivora TaxID=4796 RepID=A0A2P4WWB7_9STRA|nr:Carboxy-terminal domain cyclin [Phytophthora palmivora]
MCINRKRRRHELRSPVTQKLHIADQQLKRVKTESPTSVERMGSADNQEEEELATAAHRDEMVAAILTITSALGLSRETLHLCVGLLDRYLKVQNIEAIRLEALSISCLWIAVKFVETPTTIFDKSIKEILQRRRHTSNWTWSEILEFELNILQSLNYRIIAPTILDVLQKRMYAVEGDNQEHRIDDLQYEQRQLALYFADLLLLKARANQFSKELLVDAIWFVISGNQIADVKPPLLEPVVLLFLAHRDNINPRHSVFKPWFALRCRYGAFLPSPWKVPYDPSCACRVCEHVQDELAS